MMLLAGGHPVTCRTVFGIVIVKVRPFISIRSEASRWFIAGGFCAGLSLLLCLGGIWSILCPVRPALLEVGSIIIESC